MTKLNLGNFSQLLLLYGVFAPLMLAILVLVLGQITPGYNPFTDTVSQLGTHDKPYSTLMNTGLIAYGLCIGGAIYGLYRILYHIPRTKILTLLLSIYSLGIIFLGIFPDSPSYQNTSFYTDIVHNTFSAISYLALLIAMVFTTKIVQIEETLKPVASLGIAIFVFNLPLPIIIVFDLFEPIGGLLQRLFIASSLLWLVFISLFLYKRLPKL
jgi:hypothetical membrane protein